MCHAVTQSIRTLCAGDSVSLAILEIELKDASSFAAWKCMFLRS